MTRTTTEALRQVYGRCARWAIKVRLGRKLSVLLLLATVVAGAATYMAFAGARPFADPGSVLVMLYIDLALVLLLVAVVARRLAELWAHRQRGAAGARLHVRMAVLFALVAVTPTLIVAGFSALFFQFGLQSWFNERVSTALHDSVLAAEAYLREHQKVIRADALAMANDLNFQASLLAGNPARFSQVINTQTTLRDLAEAIVVDRQLNLLGLSTYSYSLSLERIPGEAYEQARQGEVAILVSDRDDRVRALVKLEGFFDAYLLVGRNVDPQVLAYIDNTRRAVREYEVLRGQRTAYQITFALMFVMVAVLLLLAAVWMGLVLANNLARPIAALIDAAERVRAGDLTARVTDVGEGDEIGLLARAFNRMASQLANQQHELIDANRLLDLRRRFTEAVLGNVSAGVIGLDQKGRINLPNRAASELLGIRLEEQVGHELGEAVPEMEPALDEARLRPERIHEAQIKLPRAGTAHTLLVRVAADMAEGEVKGFVVTFDDITELQSAQRTAAWADVARRIAHEIKNPLTPIQLSAERLKRKYLKEITSDPETFRNCTDTIVRQVADIGRMVDEFSAFARMPAPVMKVENLAELCREAVFLQKSAHADVEFVLTLAADRLPLPCDARQVSQALTNLLQNALDAIEGREAQPGETLARGRIVMTAAGERDRFLVTVADNGRGLPIEDRERLLEPYVTTRTRGTGLGLAIVKKIMEDHGGELKLDDNPGGGARVVLVFPAKRETQDKPPEPAALEPAPAGTLARKRQATAHGA